MKLELKHLSAYLPYGLKGYAEDIKLIDNITLHNVEFIIVEQPRAKPILRPLSDLTKEIEHNGEKFVPISELAKIGTRESKCYVTNSNNATCYVNAEFSRKGFFIYSQNTFMWQVGKNADPMIVYNQRVLFDKLFEWHFDVFGLIEKGLAIDINTIKN